MCEKTKCEICQKIANQKCSSCHNVYYCSKEHQKLHWKKHKTICRPFQISYDDLMGRCLITNRQIKPGERILQESSLIWAPSFATIPICLGCGKGIDEINSRPCTNCGWPVCSDLCEKSLEHLPECQYSIQKVEIKKFNTVHPIYECIAVLRCLYQKQFQPKIWKILNKMENHYEKRKFLPKHRISELIRRFFKLNFTEEEVMKVCGVIMINSHEVPLTEPPHIAIYEITSLFEHSCEANCTKSFTNEEQVIISSAKLIEKGQHLSICYTDPLWDTPSRRCYLYQTKFFWCQCIRCCDITEFGTNFSALKCQNGDCSGNLLPKTFLFETENKLIEWICNKCQKAFSSDFIQDILEKAEIDFNGLNKNNEKKCVFFLEKFTNYLSNNHKYLIDIKILLIHLLGQGNEGLRTLKLDDLYHKLKLCDGLIKLLKVLTPAEKRTIGLILFEWHACLAEISLRRSHPKEILSKSREILKESIENLKFEPDLLPEGKVCKQAKENLKKLDLFLNC